MEDNLAAFVSQLDLLTPRDKRGVLGLLAKTLAVDAPTAAGATGGTPSTASSSGLRRMCETLRGVSLFSSVAAVQPRAGRKIYRVVGAGDVAGHDAATVFDLMTTVEFVREWDLIFRDARYLTFASAPGVEVAHLRLVYGLPGWFSGERRVMGAGAPPPHLTHNTQQQNDKTTKKASRA